MSRVKRGVTKRHRQKKVLLAARGFQGASHRNYKWASEALLHAWSYAYRHRRERKGEFRRLWIVRIEEELETLDGDRPVRLVEVNEAVAG